ncbi:hypothetical protein MKEN_01134200 [Mycena kentingensis (nom. inval.)]|nr:hypothetical protein MKEN_01134200 [Mycena kentingensis (nom. inval.)]
MPSKKRNNKKGKKKPRASLESATSTTSSAHIRTPSPVDALVDATVVASLNDTGPHEEPFQLPENDEVEPKPPQRVSPPPSDSEEPVSDSEFPPPPFIHDPGNGHRVRHMRTFLSSFFAQPPATSEDDPIAAEFAVEEVKEMLLLLCSEGMLTEELALALWYNKSRATSRVCPACQRLYRLGDVLATHTDAEDAPSSQTSSPQLEREQEISGLCSTLCFILASYNYPAAIKSAWGTMAEDMEEDAWRLLNTSPEAGVPSAESVGLGMLVRMTRLHDLGLAQLVLDIPEP